MSLKEIKQILAEKGVNFGPSAPHSLLGILPNVQDCQRLDNSFLIEFIEDTGLWELDIPRRLRAYTIEFKNAEDLMNLLNKLLERANNGSKELHEVFREIYEDPENFLSD